MEKILCWSTCILLCLFAWINSGFACSGSCYAPPFIFGAVCQGNTGIFGYPGSKQYYSVSVNGNAGTLVCCHGRGYNARQREEWYSIGCGHENFGLSVPWGNVLSMPAIKCKGAPFGATLSFTC